MNRLFRLVLVLAFGALAATAQTVSAYQCLSQAEAKPAETILARLGQRILPQTLKRVRNPR